MPLASIRVKKGIHPNGTEMPLGLSNLLFARAKSAVRREAPVCGVTPSLRAQTGKPGPEAGKEAEFSTAWSKMEPPSSVNSFTRS